MKTHVTCAALSVVLCCLINAGANGAELLDRMMGADFGHGHCGSSKCCSTPAPLQKSCCQKPVAQKCCPPPIVHTPCQKAPCQKSCGCRPKLLRPGLLKNLFPCRKCCGAPKCGPAPCQKAPAPCCHPTPCQKGPAPSCQKARKPLLEGLLPLKRSCCCN